MKRAAPRIVFMGTPEFAVPSLDALAGEGYPLVVVTSPDRAQGRGLKLLPSAVKSRAAELGLPLLQPESLRDPAFYAALTAADPDIICVVAFKILPPEIFSLARLGAFNLHASLLPKYRGAAPINHAIMNGDTETGVTTFFLERKVDTGSMVLQRRVPIHPDDDAGALQDRLSAVGAEAVLETVRLIEAGTPPKIAQDDAAASPAPKIHHEDCVIRWDRPSAMVVNQIRGLAPSPAAFTRHEGRVIKIYRAAVRGSRGLTPGEVKREAGELLVGTADGCVALIDLQQEGRRRMAVDEFLRGYRVPDGALLG